MVGRNHMEVVVPPRETNRQQSLWPKQKTVNFLFVDLKLEISKKALYHTSSCIMYFQLGTRAL